MKSGSSLLVYSGCDLDAISCQRQQTSKESRQPGRKQKQKKMEEI